MDRYFALCSWMLSLYAYQNGVCFVISLRNCILNGKPQESVGLRVNGD